MAVVFTVEPRAGYIVVRSEGADEGLEQMLAHADALAEAARRYGCARVLSDDRKVRYLPTNLSTTLVLQEIGERFLAERYGARLEALAILPSTDAGETWRFAESTWRNRGLNVRFFLDELEAVEWLTALPFAL